MKEDGCTKKGYTRLTNNLFTRKIIAPTILGTRRGHIIVASDTKGSAWTLERLTMCNLQRHPRHGINGLSEPDQYPSDKLKGRILGGLHSGIHHGQ